MRTSQVCFFSLRFRDSCLALFFEQFPRPVAARMDSRLLASRSSLHHGCDVEISIQQRQLPIVIAR